MKGITHFNALPPEFFQHGDRLSRREFLERWERMPELKKAELIDGCPQPFSFAHSCLDTIVQMVLNVYAAKTPGCECLSNSTWLMLDSSPQPDSCLCRVPASGQIKTTGNLATGAPELIVEIAVSSRSYDLGPKLALYERAECKNLWRSYSKKNELNGAFSNTEAIA